MKFLRGLIGAYALERFLRHREKVGGHWGRFGLASKVEMLFLIPLLLIGGLIVAIVAVPIVRLILLGIIVLFVARWLRKRYHDSSSTVSGRCKNLLFVGLGLLGAIVLIAMFSKANLSFIILIAVSAAILIYRFIRKRRKIEQRRMLPNQRQVVKTAHSQGESESELEYRDFWEAVGAIADPDDQDSHQSAPTASDRLLTRKQISGVMIFSRPDEHGDVVMETFLEGHEDTDPADELEHRANAVFADDISVYPVEENAYPPFALADQWRASRGSDPDQEFDPEQIENLAPPPRK